MERENEPDEDEWTRSRAVQKKASIIMSMTDDELKGVLKGEMYVGSDHEMQHVPQKIGDRGDCGNYAIALKRFLGNGTLYGIYDGGIMGIDEPVLEHVVLDLGEGYLLDSTCQHDYHGIYEDVYAKWLYYPLDLVKITEEEIFNTLSKTNEKRISHLVSTFEIFHPPGL